MRGCIEKMFLLIYTQLAADAGDSCAHLVWDLSQALRPRVWIIAVSIVCDVATAKSSLQRGCNIPKSTDRLPTGSATTFVFPAGYYCILPSLIIPTLLNLHFPSFLVALANLEQ